VTTPPRARGVQLFPILGGLVFLVVAVLYLLQAVGALRLDHWAVLPLEAAGLIVAGLLGAVYSRRSRRPRRDAHQASTDR
jgi:hypothetical protein